MFSPLRHTHPWKTAGDFLVPAERKVGIVAHFKPFARAKSGPPPGRRDDDDYDDYDSEDDSYRYRRYRKRNTGLIVIDLGL